MRIRVHAVAVNPTDLTFRAGGRAEQLAGTSPPYLPGVDVAGVADEAGPGVSGRLSVGDRVVALVVPMGPHGGTYAEEIATAEASVVRAPENATDAEAATLLLNGAAARPALDALGLGPGQTVAIVSVKGWHGPAERGIAVHPISAFDAVTDTALLEELRDLAEDGVLTLRVAEVLPARLAAEAHRRLAAGGIRGRIVLDFQAPLT